MSKELNTLTPGQHGLLLSASDEDIREAIGYVNAERDWHRNDDVHGRPWAIAHTLVRLGAQVLVEVREALEEERNETPSCTPKE